MYFKDLDTFGRFSVVFTRETTFVTYRFLSCTSSPFGKRSALKGKNLLPIGANSFLLEQIPFRKNKNKTKTIWTAVSLEGLSIALKIRDHLRIYEHWATHLYFPPFFFKERQILWHHICFPFWKGLLWKETCALKGCQFFPFRQDLTRRARVGPFTEGR